MCLNISIMAQDKVFISKPELSFADNKLTVKYDITGCGRGENVNITMKATNSKGNSLKPVFVEGDLGKMVPCGLGKTIIWDIAKDKIKMDDEISIEIEGEKEVPPVTQQAYMGPKKLTRGNIMLSSVFVPGLGMKKASGKSIYFLFTGLVYGGAGTAIYFNLSANKLKADYNNATGEQRDAIYDDWQHNYDMAKYAAFATAGIWVVNMVCSALIPVKESAQKKVSFYFMPDSRNNLLFGARMSF